MNISQENPNRYVSITDMNITKENFNQYVAIAYDLACKGLYFEATKIALKAYELWDSWADDENDNPAEVEIDRALQILTSSQWREMDSPEEYALLAETLNYNNYWSNQFIVANHNYTGTWVLREKALAYHMLATRWATGQLRELYMGYAQKYISAAIDIFGEIAKTQNNADAAELCNDCKIDLAMIRLSVSNKLARMTAIPIFGEELTDEQKERLMEIYQQSTDVLFDDFFSKKGIAVVQNCEIEDNNAKEDALNFLLEMYSEPGNEDLYWWAFTHKNAPDERKKIRFVKNIEEAADNDFEDIPWVFTLDRYPFDIEFDEGDEPVENSVYEIDPNNTDKYHKI